MRWYKKAAKEIGHGNTLEGQLFKKELSRLAKEVHDLKTIAASGGPDSVLPKWRPDVRQSIFLLPSIKRLPMMSMYELNQLSIRLQAIQAKIQKYDSSTMMHILGAK